MWLPATISDNRVGLAALVIGGSSASALPIQQTGQHCTERSKLMTKREQEQLQRLLEKKEREEKHDHEFFSEVRRRKVEVLRILDINEESARMVQNRAADAGITTEQMISLIDRLPTEWIRKTINRQ